MKTQKQKQLLIQYNKKKTFLKFNLGIAVFICEMPFILVIGFY